MYERCFSLHGKRSRLAVNGAMRAANGVRPRPTVNGAMRRTSGAQRMQRQELKAANRNCAPAEPVPRLASNQPYRQGAWIRRSLLPDSRRQRTASRPSPPAAPRARPRPARPGNHADHSAGTGQVHSLIHAPHPAVGRPRCRPPPGPHRPLADVCSRSPGDQPVGARP